MKISCWVAFFSIIHVCAAAGAYVFEAHNASTACSDVSRTPPLQQCDVVRTYCNTSEYRIGLLNYLSIFYCSPVRLAPSLLIAIGIAVCFVSLALTASDFLCPNLYSISKFLRLSDNLAGLTLLALGNSSPDVISTFKALDVGATALAVSELSGAALFVLTVVVGAISIAKPFKVPRFHFVRDVAFYFIMTCICLFSFASARLTYFNSTVLFFSYTVYVVVVVLSHSVLLEKIIHSSNIARLRSSYDPRFPDEQVGSTFGSLADDHTPLPSIDSLGSFEPHAELLDEYDAFLESHHYHDERLPIETGSYGLKMLLKELAKHSNNLRNNQPIYLTTERPMVVSNEEPQTNNQASFIHADSGVNVTDDQPSQEKPIWSLLLPDFDSENSILAIAYNVMALPATILLRLTTPNRDKAIQYADSLTSNAFNFNSVAGNVEEEDEFLDFNFTNDLRVFKLQMFTAPIFVASVLFSSGSYFFLSILTMTLLAALLSYLVPVPNKNPRTIPQKMQLWNYFGSFVGFVVSLTWISLFATEIVAILKAIAAIFDIGDDIVGTTVFALGNSIGDLVSNLTIARMGMPVMAFGACFGGPLLSLSSLGFSAFAVMYFNGQDAIAIEFSPILKVNCFTLLFSLVSIAIYIPRNGWVFDKKIGLILVGTWVVSNVLILSLGL